MGTDCILRAEEPCPCGQTTISVYVCMPDHGWATNNISIKTHFECSPCQKSYVLEVQSGTYLGPVVLVKRSDFEKRSERQKTLQEAQQNFYLSVEYKRLIDAFTSKAESMASLAAAFRWLTACNFPLHCTEGTFRKHIHQDGGLTSWINRQRNWSYVPFIIRALNDEFPQITAAIEKLQHLKNETDKPLPIVGKPLMGQLSKY